MTVWRKRWVKVYAMVGLKPTDPNFYPMGTLDKLRPIIVSAYADPDANKNTYLDLVVEDAQGDDAKTLHTKRWTDIFDDVKQANSPTRYVAESTNLHTSEGGHPDNTYQLIGVHIITAVVNGVENDDILGDSNYRPHSIIAVGTIAKFPPLLTSSKDQTACGLGASAQMRITVQPVDGSTAPIERVFDLGLNRSAPLDERRIHFARSNSGFAGDGGLTFENSYPQHRP